MDSSVDSTHHSERMKGNDRHLKILYGCAERETGHLEQELKQTSQGVLKDKDNTNKEKAVTNLVIVVSICLVDQLFTLIYQRNNETSVWSGVIYFKQLEK